jgi:murein DD-endopeptidase MepM/ murein hydrolase activator NlpD
MTRLQRLASVPLVLALLIGVAQPAGAASSPAAARKQQEQIRAKRAQTAAKLNALKSSDAQLEKAVQALANQVKGQSAKLASARQAQAVAEASVTQAEDRISATEAQMHSLQSAVVDRAVAAYVRPQQTALATIGDAKDLGEASRRASMLRQVANNDRDVIDQLHATKEDLDLERQKADAARAVAAKRRETAKNHLIELNKNLAEKARLEKALEARIKDITGEAEALAAADAAVSEVIRRASVPVRASRSGDVADSAGGRVSGSGLRWPVGGPVTSEFGYRWGRLHAGIDIGAGMGTPIRAAKGGTVIFAGQQSGYGNVVIIDHGGGLSTLYGHQSRIAVNDGEDVGGGQVIGYVGSTGHSTGPHLHFETRIGGSPENPRRYLP